MSPGFPRGPQCFSREEEGATASGNGKGSANTDVCGYAVQLDLGPGYGAYLQAGFLKFPLLPASLLQ